MPIIAKQEIDTGYNFKVKQVEVPHPTRDGKSGYFMNIREDNDDILGWTTERYGLVQHGDAVTFADNAFAERDIEVDRKVIVTEGGAKLRAQYDLKGDLFKAEVPGPIADKLTPRIADTARRLWLIWGVCPTSLSQVLPGRARACASHPS